MLNYTLHIKSLCHNCTALWANYSFCGKPFNPGLPLNCVTHHWWFSEGVHACTGYCIHIPTSACNIFQMAPFLTSSCLPPAINLWTSVLGMPLRKIKSPLPTLTKVVGARYLPPLRNGASRDLIRQSPTYHLHYQLTNSRSFWCCNGNIQTCDTLPTLFCIPSNLEKGCGFTVSWYWWSW